MIYSTEYRTIHVEESTWVRGGLYKINTVSKRVRVCVMRADVDDAKGLYDLAIFSDRLGIPIVWEYKNKPQTCSLTIQAYP